MKIAYLGDENSHTYAAALRAYGGEDNFFVSCKSVVACFDLVENGSVGLAVVPLENSVEGTVRETLDCFTERSVYICKEINMPITHSLIGKRGAGKSDIKTLYSHYQALSQCRKYISENLPDAKVIPVASTSDALKQITANSIGAIAGKAGPATNAVLEKNIEDSKSNETRFAAITQKPHFDGGKCFVIFDTADKPGALVGVLEQMQKSNVNMTKLESRPKGDKLGRYIFFTDFNFNGTKESLTEFLAQLTNKTNYLKFLGKYDCVSI